MGAVMDIWQRHATFCTSLTPFLICSSAELSAAHGTLDPTGFVSRLRTSPGESGPGPPVGMVGRSNAAGASRHAPIAGKAGSVPQRFGKLSGKPSILRGSVPVSSGERFCWYHSWCSSLNVCGLNLYGSITNLWIRVAFACWRCICKWIHHSFNRIERWWLIIDCERVCLWYNFGVLWWLKTPFVRIFRLIFMRFHSRCIQYMHCELFPYSTPLKRGCDRLSTKTAGDSIESFFSRRLPFGF